MDLQAENASTMVCQLQPGKMKLRMRLGLTSFKHVGIFPEQAANWDFIYEQIHKIGNNARVLNLFAYTEELLWQPAVQAPTSLT